MFVFSSFGALLALSCVYVVIAAVIDDSDQPAVILGDGKIVGKIQKSVSGRKINAFLGIPFAEPPIGSLRFQEPVPAKELNGVYRATGFSNPCMQFHWTIASPPQGSEDCLYLNVYTPSEPLNDTSCGRSNEPMDVVFHIHGGGFQLGAGHYHGPEYLLDENDVVLVTFNYRLGPLGFLSLEDDLLPGNLGLKDQNLALRWVNRHIAAFGGDPKKVTVLGFSSGGVSAHLHMLSPQSAGLFHRMVSMSGSALNPFVQKNARTNALKVAEALNCSTKSSQSIVDCLKSKPASDVAGAGKIYPHWLSFDLVPFYPVVEKPSKSAFISSDPEDIIISGKAHDVPYLMSYNIDECAFLTSEVLTVPKNKMEMMEKWDDLLPIVLKYYVNDTDKHRVGTALKIYADRFNEMCDERYFAIGIDRSLLLQAKHLQSPGYSYVLSYTYDGERHLGEEHNMTGLDKAGARHGDDYYHVFKTDFIPMRTGRPEADKLSKTLTSLLMEFIKNTTTGWTPVKSDLPNLSYLSINSADEGSWVVKSHAKISEADRFWKSLPIE